VEAGMNPHSEDLRKKGMMLIDDGMGVYAVAKLLKISKSSLYLWIKRREETGFFAPKKDWRKGYGHKIPNLEVFKEFVDKNRSLTTKQMAEKWGNITLKTICKWLHRIGYTRKKRYMDTKNVKKKSVRYIWTN
jgi:transposase